MRLLLAIALLLSGMAWGDIPTGAYARALLPKPTSDLTDYSPPVNLTNLPASWWALVDTSDGTKGRVVKDDGTTELAADWIDFDDTAETGVIRFLYSGTLSSSLDQYVRIYPPLAANASVAASATYGSDSAYDSSWEGYWPFDGDANDRTANGLDGTVNGHTAQSSTSKIGSSYSFDGLDDYIDAGTSPTGGLGALTAMVWVKQNLTTVNRMVIEDGTGFITNSFFINMNAAAPEVLIYGTSFQNRTADSALSTTVFSHIALKWQSGADIEGFVNGVSGGTLSGTQQAGNLTTGNANLTFGGRPAAPINLDYSGWIDEIQIHSTARAADWIEHEHALTFDNATEFGMWTLVTPGGFVYIPRAMRYGHADL